MMLIDDPMPGGARLMLQRPKAGNLLHRALLERIARGLDGLAVDPDCREGPTCGHGGNFAAGAAIRALRGKRRPEFRGT